MIEPDYALWRQAALLYADQGSAAHERLREIGLALKSIRLYDPRYEDFGERPRANLLKSAA